MRLGVLTSSRADYSIYLPLLKRLQNDPFFNLAIIAFGTHLSKQHGSTVHQIEADGFKVSYKIETLPADDSPAEIANSMGKTISAFSSFWNKEKFDLMFCLGDRYEMFAACASSIPFNVKLAHIHGGEQTQGAIDDVFRHSLTQMSSIHFTTTEVYKNRVIEIKGSNANVFNVGSLSIDNLRSMELLSVDAFKNKFQIDLSRPSILITFHPETVALEKNSFFISELLEALNKIRHYQFVFTMPNADPMGNHVRAAILEFVSKTPDAVSVESFGTMGYLSCMKHCSFLLGNTSSGFAEASFFPKFVINLGDRQKGRIVTSNIYNCKVERDEIIKAVGQFSNWSPSQNEKVYGDGNAAQKIIEILKSLK